MWSTISVGSAFCTTARSSTRRRNISRSCHTLISSHCGTSRSGGQTACTDSVGHALAPAVHERRRLGHRVARVRRRRTSQQPQRLLGLHQSLEKLQPSRSGLKYPCQRTPTTSEGRCALDTTSGSCRHSASASFIASKCMRCRTESVRIDERHDSVWQPTVLLDAEHVRLDRAELEQCRGLALHFQFGQCFLVLLPVLQFPRLRPSASC